MYLYDLLEHKNLFHSCPFAVEEILPLDTIITDPMKHSMNHPENSFPMRLVLDCLLEFECNLK